MSEQDNVIWVLVADGEKARLFKKGARSQALGAIGEKLADPSDKGLANSNQGRTFDSHGHGHHKLSTATNFHEHEKGLFLKDIAAHLETADNNHEFDQLVLVAPPKALGHLRESLHKQVHNKIMAEIGKDLTHLPPQEIEEHLIKEKIGWM